MGEVLVLVGAETSKHTRGRGGGHSALPHALLTLTVAHLQTLDPGVALLGAAGEAVGTELLRYFGEDVAIVRVASDAPLHLSTG